MTSHWLCPIYFFNYNGESITFPEGIKIIKIPVRFVEYLDRKYPDILPTILSKTFWAIDIEVEPIDTTNMNITESMSIGFKQHDNSMNLLYDLITSLRIYKKGRIVAGLAVSGTFDEAGWHIGGSTSWNQVSNILFFEEEPAYKLKQNELEKLIALFKQIRKYRALNILDNIRIALERFHSSYHGNIEDRIIDQMIAFESLYIGNEQELTYKLAIRSAFLLRNRKDHRILIFKNMKKSYNYRSRIVHGNNPPDRKTLKEIVPHTEDYLRQSIKVFLILLSQGKSLKEIRENLLDENILNNRNTLTID
jgi:hypothetical protein